MKSSFIGIGAQKAASTWVHRVLEDHPEVIVSEPKELNFFFNEYDKGVVWYESHFSKVDKNIVTTGEISPLYFNSYDAAVRAKKYNPNFKIIVTLRDPVERAYSHHLHYIRVGSYKGNDNSFESGMSEYSSYLDRSRYYTHLKYWFELFPREQILVLIQENISKNPEQSVKDLYSFLGIDVLHKSVYLNRRANVSYTVKNPSLESFLKKGGACLKTMGLASLVKKINTFPFIFKMREKNRIHLKSVVSKMKPETEEFMMRELSDEVIALAELIQVDSLPWKTWRFAKQKVNK